MHRSQRSNKSIRRAAIRHQNGEAARGGYTPSMAEAIAVVLRMRESENDIHKESSKSNEKDRRIL